jgi:CPA1 family monovalent cation:H+ antiporter
VPEGLYTAAALLGVVAAVAWIAERSRLPMPILLVIAGIALALTPGLPTVELDGEFVMLALLPPLIYFAAFTMSWQAFRANLRLILLLANHIGNLDVLREALQRARAGVKAQVDPLE